MKIAEMQQRVLLVVEEQLVTLGISRLFLPQETLIEELVQAISGRLSQLGGLTALPKDLRFFEQHDSSVVIGGGAMGTLSVCEALRPTQRPVMAVMGVSADDDPLRVWEVLDAPTLRDHGTALLSFSPRSPLSNFLGRTLSLRNGGRLWGIRGMDLILAALGELFSGDYARALSALGHLLESRIQVLPVANTFFDVIALTRGEDYEILWGASEISRRSWGISPDAPLDPIWQIWLHEGERAVVCNQAQGAIKNAPIIVVAPGDFYASTLPIFLFSGVREAVNLARSNGAKVIWVLNGCNQRGQTEGWTATRYVEAILSAGIEFDTLLVHEPDETLPPWLDSPEIDLRTAVIRPFNLSPLVQIQPYTREPRVYYRNDALAAALREVIASL